MNRKKRNHPVGSTVQDDELYKVKQVGTRSYWVSIGRYWLIHDSTRSAEGDTE